MKAPIGPADRCEWGVSPLAPHVVRKAIHQRASVYLRTGIKRFVMRAYCAGWMPAAVVTAAFKVFGLRAL